MEYQVLLAMILSVIGGIGSILTIITYIRKSENRITLIETNSQLKIKEIEKNITTSLDNISEQIEDLKHTKQDKEIISLELKYINEKLNKFDVKLDKILDSKGS
jgi:tetrahydromethanopterin S-methyltransferase subunit B